MSGRPARWAVRLVVVAGAIAAVGLLASSLSAHDRCVDAGHAIFATRGGPGAAARERAALARIQGSCRGTSALVSAAGALAYQGRDREALALALRAARREPANAQAWAGVLALARRDQAPTLARAAERRLAHLDPLQAPAQPSLKRRAGRSTR